MQQLNKKRKFSFYLTFLSTLYLYFKNKKTLKKTLFNKYDNNYHSIFIKFKMSIILIFIIKGNVMVLKKQKNSFESSMFYKINMKINKNLPKVYAITLLISMLTLLTGIK